MMATANTKVSASKLWPSPQLLRRAEGRGRGVEGGVGGGGAIVMALVARIHVIGAPLALLEAAATGLVLVLTPLLL